MSTFAPPWPGVPGVADLLAGGSLSTGPTGLAGLQGAALNGTNLPYAHLGKVFGSGLAGQVPVGVGRQAAMEALNLGPAASSLSGGGGLLSRLPSLPSVPKGIAAGGVASHPFMRLGGGLAAGSAGSWLVDQLNPGGQNSNIEQGLQGAAMGAGLGASVGSIFPGIGTAVGGVVGGVAGGAIGVLGNVLGFGGGEDKPEPVEILATAMDTARLSPEYEEAILQTYETQMDLAERLEGKEKEDAEKAALEAAGQMVLQAMQTQQAERMRQAQGLGGAGGGPGLLAMQQQAQQIFEPIAQDIETSAGLYAQQMQGIRPNLPASYQGVADAQVARELTSADKLANAYRAQAALTPLVDRLTQYQSDYNSFASQLFQQQQAATAAAMAQGGGGLFGAPAAGGTDLLAQLQPT